MLREKMNKWICQKCGKQFFQTHFAKYCLDCRSVMIEQSHRSAITRRDQKKKKLVEQLTKEAEKILKLSVKAKDDQSLYWYQGKYAGLLVAIKILTEL